MTASYTAKAIALLLGAAVALNTARAHENDKGKPAALPEAANAEEAWTNAQTALKAIQTAASAKKYDAIHDDQEKLAAALKQVQEKGKATDKARFEGALKNAIAASERVHVGADAKDPGKVESGLRALEASMQIAERYFALEK